MKISKFLVSFGVATTLITGTLSLPNQNIKEVQAQTMGRPFVVFVNGSGDCCAEEMYELKRRLRPLNAEIWNTSYASFKDGSTTNKISVETSVGRGSLSVDSDALFLMEGEIKLNNIPANRPIILIGHSFGGDSILKLLPRIKRRIQLVAVLDPVAGGNSPGFRTPNNWKVPSNVDVFVNRYQQKALLPFNFLQSGKIPNCDAKIRCFQNKHNSSHTTLPTSNWIQNYVGDKIDMALNSFKRTIATTVTEQPLRPPLPQAVAKVPQGLYRKPDGTFISANESGAFCSFISPGHFEYLSGRYDLVKPVSLENISAMSDHGPCAVRLAPGVYRIPENGDIINSNGEAYCRYKTMAHYEGIDGRPITPLPSGVPLFAMANHYNCPDKW